MNRIPVESELRVHAITYVMRRCIFRIGIPATLAFALLSPDMAYLRPPVVSWSIFMLKWAWLMTPLFFIELSESLSRGQYDAVVSRTSQTIRLWRWGWKHEFVLTSDGYSVKRTPGALGYLRALLLCYELTTPSGRFLVQFIRINRYKRMRRMTGQEEGSPWEVED
jgi:hypothetical protein